MSTEDQGNAALDMNSAAAAFAAFDEAPASEEQNPAGEQAAPEGETEEQAAERLALEAAQGEKPEGEQSAEPQKILVKVDGKDVELTPDEVAEAYKAGLRQQDYTKKTMEVAEQRKAAEAETAKARQEREAYAQKLEGFATQADYELRALTAQLTDELLESDPVEYMRKQRIAQQRHAELAQAQGELQRITDQRKTEQEAATKAHLEEQREQLLAKRPEWKDEAKANAAKAQITKYMVDNGFAPEEVSFNDHRLILVAHEAAQYRELMAKAKEATKKLASVPPKVERPGNAESAPKPTDGRTRAMRNLKASNSLNDAAAAFGELG